jgi:hypothetical protein
VNNVPDSAEGNHPILGAHNDGVIPHPVANNLNYPCAAHSAEIIGPLEAERPREVPIVVATKHRLIGTKTVLRIEERRNPLTTLVL